MKIPPIALFLLLITSALAQIDVSQRYEQMLVRSPGAGSAFDKVYEAALARGDVAEVRERWRKSAESGGPQAAAYTLMGALLDERMNRSDAARVGYEKFTELAPGDPAGWNALADFERRGGRLSQASDALAKSLDLAKDPGARAEIYRSLATLLARQFETEKAAAVWMRALKEFPDDAQIVGDATQLLLEAGKVDAAREVLNESISRASAEQRLRLQMQLAQVDQREGKTDAAVQRYDDLLAETAPASWLHRELRNRIEVLYREQDDLPVLEAYYERRLRANAREIESARRLAAVLSELHRDDDAVGWLKQVAEWAPERTDLQVQIASQLVEAGRPDDAIEILDRVVRATPGGDRRFAEQVGEARWKKFQAGKAAADREAALAAWALLAPAESKRADGFSRQAATLLRFGLKAEAAEALRRGLAVEPAANDVRERLGETLLDLNKTDEAWKVLVALVPAQGATAENYLQLARVQRAHGKTAEAETILRSGLAAFPGNIEMLELVYAGATEREDDAAALKLCDELLRGATQPDRIDDLEARKVRHLSALDRADDTANGLIARLDAGEKLSEPDLRLLMRLVLTGNFRERATKILDLARSQYPKSISVARLRLAASQQFDEPHAQLAVIKDLEDLDAANRGRWLRQAAAVWEGVGESAEALASAKEVIESSPTDADSYLFAADLAARNNQPAQAVAWLREAVRLTDRPREPLMRLAQVYRDLGQTEDAIRALEDAFQAEEEMQGKISIAGTMAEVYLGAGRIGELIESFQRRQRGEGTESWRYALYLAAIYEKSSDTTLAREQLTRALASRPADATLLRRIIAILERSYDQEQTIDYRKRLAEAEPSAANTLDLASIYFITGRTQEALALLQKTAAEWRSRPQLLDRVMPAALQGGSADILRKEIDAAIAARPDAWELRFRQLEARTRDGDPKAAAADALQILRDMLARPGTAQAPALAQGSLRPGGRYEKVAKTNPISARIAANELIRSTLARYLAQLSDGNSYMASRSMASSIAGLAASPPRDLAIAWYWNLMKTAKLQKEAQAELQKLIADNAALPATEKMVLAMEAGLSDEARARVREIAADKNADRMTNEAALQVALQQKTGDDEARQVIRTLLERTSLAGQEWKNQPLLRYDAWKKIKDTTRASALLSDWIAGCDAVNDGEFATIADLCVDTKNVEGLRTLIGKREQALRKNPGFGGGRDMIIERFRDAVARVPRGPKPDDPTLVIAGLLFDHFLILSTKPATFSSSRFSSRDNEVLLPNRLFNSSQLSWLRDLGGKNGAAECTRAILAQRLGTVSEQGRPSLEYMVASGEWAGGKKAEAAARMSDLAAKTDDLGIQLTASRMLVQTGAKKQALAMLRTIRPSPNPLYHGAMMDYIRLAQAEHLDADAREAALRLSHMRLDRQQQQGLVLVLLKLELRDEAKKMAAQISSRRTGNTGYAAVEEMRTLVAENKREEAIRAADKLLAADPVSGYRSGYFQPAQEAISLLAELGDLDRRKAEWETQLQSAPNSQRLLLLLAWASPFADGQSSSRYMPGAPLPAWLRLTRKGDDFSAEISADGKAWVELGRAKLPLGKTPVAGCGISSFNYGMGGRGRVVCDDMTLRQDGKTESLRQNPSAWRQGTLGEKAATSTAEVRDGRLFLSPGESGGGQMFYYRTLEGDGSVTVKVSILGGQGGAFLAMRESTALDAAYVQIYTGPGYASFGAGRRDARQLGYWKKLAELRPDDPNFQIGYASALSRLGKGDEALEILRPIVSKNAATSLYGAAYEIMQIYLQAGKIGELLDQVMAVKPPAENTNNAYQFRYVFQSLASVLASAEKPADAERVLKRGIEIFKVDLNEDQFRTMLGELYLDQDRLDEARKVTLEQLLGPKDKRGTFAMRVGSTTYTNSGMATDADLLIERAREAGVLDQVVEAALKPSSIGANPSELDYMRLGVLFAARRPEGIAEFKRLLEKEKNLDPRASREGMFFFLNQAKQDPAAWPLLLRWLERLSAGEINSSSDVSQQLITTFAWKRLVDLTGTTAQKKKALDLTAERLIDAMIAAPGYYLGVQIPEMYALAGDLARGGDVPAARKFFEAIGEYYRMRGGSISETRRLDEAMRGELDACEGKGEFLPIAWAGRERGELNWAIVPKLAQQRDSSRVVPSLRPPFPNLTTSPNPSIDGKFDLEILAGPDPSALKQVGIVRKARSTGTFADLPRGAAFVAIKLLAKDGPAVTSAPLPVPRGKNLLPSIMDGKKLVWQPGRGVSVSAGPAAPSGLPPVVAVNVAYGSSRLGSGAWKPALLSPKINLRPGGSYVFSSWMKGTNGGVGVRFLNAKDEELTTVSPRGGGDRGWGFSSVRFSPAAAGGDLPIPEGAVAIQCFVQSYEYVDVCEPYIGEL